MYCVETNNLTYSYSDNEIVLNNICLQVPTGSIYGFLGSNGAGKTTLLKLLLGLLRKQEGVISIFNDSLFKNRIEILKNIGSLIESPSLYSHLSAYDNLKIWQNIYQCPEQRIDDVLRIIGLNNTGNKKTGKFSLGMKQRLSIGISLLHNPKLLILDEPTNGLDPSGILEIRELLIKINKEFGITIIISSHLLGEIEKMVTHVGIINKGSILFQGAFEDLLLNQKKTNIILETNNILKTHKILIQNNVIFKAVNGYFMISNFDKLNVAKLNTQLVNDDIEVYQISYIKNDLESIFIDLTKN